MRFFDNKRFSERGEPIKVIYSPIVNDDGTITLKESGKENLDDYINSFKDEVDINQLIARFTNGEVGVFNQRQGYYGDFTEFPKTYAEMLQLQINSKNFFDSLPVPIKEKFDNDANQFFAQTGSKEWIDIMSSLHSDGNQSSDDIVIDKEEKGEIKE